MPSIDNQSYTKICAKLASSLSISIAAARRQVELAAAKEGLKDLASRQAIAEKLLKKSISRPKKGELTSNKTFDNLLKSLAEDDNFMIED